MNRIDALRLIAAEKGRAVSISTMRALPDWWEVGGAADFHLDNRTCMGASAALGLGIALARPDRRVIVLDGDGSLLMQLGGLASIAGLAPPNFYHFVLLNGVYETTGRQPLPAAHAVDFVALARAAGYRHAVMFETIGDLHARLRDMLETRGPVLIALAIDAEHDHRPVPSNRPADQAGRLRAQLLG